MKTAVLAAWTLALTLSLLSCTSRDSDDQELFSGEKKYVDLTYPLDRFNLIYPEYGNTLFKMDTLATIARDGFLLFSYRLADHLGTHIDAPAHLMAGAATVDRLPLQSLFANAVVIDISNYCDKNPDYLLRRQDIEVWEEVYRYIPEHALVLVHTGWGSRWGNARKYFNFDARGRMHFPGVSVEAAEFLLTNRNITGIGIDVPLIDGGLAEGFPVHNAVLQAGKYVLENVANLDRMPARNAKVVVAPLNIAGGSGSQVRILAIVP